jgi:peptide/nickel transport system ATP-binding protein
MKPLLEVVDLCVTYAVRLDERDVALSGVSFIAGRGETLGVLGESGSGRSTLAAALLRILHANGKIERAFVNFEGQDLMRLNASCTRFAPSGGFAAKNP